MMIDVPNILGNFNTPLKESVTIEIPNEIHIMQFYIAGCKSVVPEIVFKINIMLLYISKRNSINFMDRYCIWAF